MPIISMHATNAAQKAMESAKAVGAKTSVTIDVGELCEFFPHEIKSALERLTGWKVEVLESQGYIECACGYKGRPKILVKEHGHVLYECPDCGSKPQKVEGDSVKILKAE